MYESLAGCQWGRLWSSTDYSVGGVVGTWGQQGLRHIQELFVAWHGFRQGTTDRAGLQAALEPVQQAVRDWLTVGLALEGPAAQHWSRALLARDAAL